MNLAAIEKLVNLSHLTQEDLSFPQTKASLKLPLVIKPKNQADFDFLRDFIKNNHQELLSLINNYGGVLFRGFDITTAEEFDEIMSLYQLPLDILYPAATPRNHVSKNVFTSTEAHDNFPIFPHTEMVIAHMRPILIAFYCDTEPQIYGETPIFDNRGIYNDLSSSLQNKLKNHGIKYSRTQEKEYRKFALKTRASWSNAFQTSDKKRVESICKKNNWLYSWGKNDTLTVESLINPLVTHPQTQEICLNIYNESYESIYTMLSLTKSRRSWFKHLLYNAYLWYLNAKKSLTFKTTFGNNEQFSAKENKEITNAFWQNSVVFKWRRSDVLILDNIATSHARMNVIKPRRILTCLAGSYISDTPQT